MSLIRFAARLVTTRRPSTRVRPTRGRRPWLEFECVEARTMLSGTPAPDPALLGRYVPKDAPTVGSDGNLWFVESDSAYQLGQTIAQVSPDGSITEFPLPSGHFVAFQSGLTLGPDGNLWFAESQTGDSQKNDAIGRVSPSGTITEFSLPAGHLIAMQSQPKVGPDGNLWFLEYGRAAQISMTGVITEFATPTSQDPGLTIAIPSGLTVGPDGNFWFAQDLLYGATNTFVVDRITTQGVISEFPAGPIAGFGYQSHMIASPAGNLYLIGGEIDQVLMTGAITQIVAPFGAAFIGGTFDSAGNLWIPEEGFVGDTGTEVVAPDGSAKHIAGSSFGQNLTLGPDGNLWFADSKTFDPTMGYVGPTVFGYLAPDGTQTLFPTTVNGAVLDAPTLGPDGNMWFTESATLGQGPAVVRVAPDGTVSEFFTGSSVGLPLENRLPPTPPIAEIPTPVAALPPSSAAAPSSQTTYAVPEAVAFGSFGPTRIAPKIESVKQSPSKSKRAELTLSFNVALNVGHAENTTNYTVIRTGPRGRARAHARHIALESATYDAAMNTVTLTTVRPLNWARHYRLTVNGSSSTGLLSASGARLDGTGHGSVGINFVTELHAPGVTLSKVKKHAHKAH